MAAVDAYDPSQAVRATVFGDPDVGSVELVGSRAAGIPTELSDWDYRICSADPVATAGRLPGLVGVGSLAGLWDPLADRAVYMIVLPGAVKVDLFPGLPSGREPEPPPEVSAVTP